MVFYAGRVAADIPAGDMLTEEEILAAALGTAHEPEKAA
jgi:hypothetical protein